KVVLEFPNIYGDMYIAMGLAEYYKASGDIEARDQALRTAITVFERADSSEYAHEYGEHGSKEKGIQRLGTWQHFLGSISPVLRTIPDQRLDEIADYAAHKV